MVRGAYWTEGCDVTPEVVEHSGLSIIQGMLRTCPLSEASE